MNGERNPKIYIIKKRENHLATSPPFFGFLSPFIVQGFSYNDVNKKLTGHFVKKGKNLHDICTPHQWINKKKHEKTIQRPPASTVSLCLPNKPPAPRSLVPVDEALPQQLLPSKQKKSTVLKQPMGKG